MDSSMHSRPLARPAIGRLLAAGALASGALLLSAPAALAGHMKMANGVLCPHAAGTEVATGDLPPVTGPERAASTGPIAPAASGVPAPATKAPARAPAQRAGSSSAAQRPATTTAGAQAQRPAAAQVHRPAVAQVQQPAPAQAQAPVAPAPRAVAPRTVARKPAAKAPRVTAATRAPQLLTRTERPAAYGDGAVRPTAHPAATPGRSVAIAIAAGLLAVLGAATLVMLARLQAHRAERRRHDAAIEAELQEMISEARARDRAADERELSAR